MNDDYIKRQDAINAVIDYLPVSDVAVEILQQIPRVSLKRPTAKWIRVPEYDTPEEADNDNYFYTCSNCHHSDLQAKDVVVRYCWNCGAEMEREKDIE